MQVSATPPPTSSRYDRLVRQGAPPGTRAFEIASIPPPPVWRDGDGRRHLPRRLYLVTPPASPDIGDVVALRAHVEGEDPVVQRIARRVAPSRVHTDWHDDEPRTIDRFAILDRGSMRGPTFVAIDDARYVRHEHDPAYVRREWEAMKRSSCGGGPLSRPLDAWVKAHRQLCMPRS